MRRLSLSLLLGLAACEAGALTVEGLDKDAPDTDASSVDTDPVDSPADTDGETAVLDTAPGIDSGLGADPCNPAGGDGSIPDLTKAGSLAVERANGSSPVGSCTMEWRRLRPKNATPHPTAIVLSHGFQRAADQMIGWAEHLASWGFEVWVPSLCHATILDTDHERNGKDLAGLVDEVAPGRPVLFLGHSAGGLASVVAGATSTATAGVLGLDLVDNANLGKKTAPALTDVPVWGIHGRSTACNSNANGIAVYGAAPRGGVLRIPSANHCDFENPSDWVCNTTCGLQLPGQGGGFDDATRKRAISALATSFAMVFAGVDPDGVQYWAKGCAPHEALRSSGLVK
ncbi:MAG: hypothetical protein H6732_18150 [Alphaproteobacteria bacterium]|nr:hypothetical protein [Alphaproteobacteria bacterium]